MKIKGGDFLIHKKILQTYNNGYILKLYYSGQNQMIKQKK